CEPTLPVSQGFGVSAAAALSTALALDDALGMKTTRDELVAIAHETEVECGTGLGDVVPASMGGMDVRLKPGAPGHAEVRKFPVEADLLLAVIGPELPTKAVLHDPKKVAAINRVGGALVDEFSRDPTLERLFELGARFAERSGLADKRVLEVIRASRMFGRAMMAMLGNSVVATGSREQLATLYLKFGTLQRCGIDNEGARVLSSLAQCEELVIPANVEESDSRPGVEPSMRIIHVGEGFLELAPLAEMPRILEVRSGHSKEVLRNLPQVGARRRSQLDSGERLLRQGNILVDQRAKIHARPSSAALKPFPLPVSTGAGQSSMTLTLSPP